MQLVSISSIKLTGWNPRKKFDEEQLKNLAQSIEAHGILEPLIVRPGSKKGSLDLVAGERRLRAATIAKLKKVPVIIRDLDDKEAREIMLLENLQREDLLPMEEAKALKQLVKDGITQESLAKRIGKSQPWIANRIRILDGPKGIRELVEKGDIAPKHAMVMLMVKDLPKVLEFVEGWITELLDEGYVVTTGEVKRAVTEGLENEDCYCLSELPRYVQIEGEYGYHQQRDWIKKFDQKKCKECPNTMMFEKLKYCTKPKCFQQKVLASEKALQAIVDKKAAKSAKKSGGAANYEERPSGKSDQSLSYVEKVRNRNQKLLDSGKTAKDFQKVDSRRIGYGDYSYLGDSGIDKSQCKTCVNCVPTSDDTLCIKPHCFSRKRNHHSKEATRRTIEAIEIFVKQEGWEKVHGGIIGPIMESINMNYWRMDMKFRESHTAEEFAKMSLEEQTISILKSWFLRTVHMKPEDEHKDLVAGYNLRKAFNKTKADSQLVHIKVKDTHKQALCKYQPVKSLTIENVEIDDGNRDRFCKECVALMPKPKKGAK